MNTTPKYDNLSNTVLHVMTLDGPIAVQPGATFEVTLKRLAPNSAGDHDIDLFLASKHIAKHTNPPADPMPDPPTAGEGEVDTSPTGPPTDDSDM